MADQRAIRRPVGSELDPRRIRIAFGIILAGYVILVLRLLYLQGAHGRSIRRAATAARTHTIEVTAQRGTILDRDDKPLAVNLYSGTLAFDGAMLKQYEKSGAKPVQVERRLAASIAATSAITGIPPDRLEQLVISARAAYAQHKSRFCVIQKDVSLAAATRIRHASPALLGFTLQDGARRYYASGAAAAQVVGFVGVGADHRIAGMAGLERGCGPWLKETNGHTTAEVDARRREIPETRIKSIPAQDGLDIHTTLDKYAQEIATQEAQKIVAAFKPAGVSIVIVDPISGDILALVSLPNYDPNPGLANSITGDSQWERCATRLYEPGSTLKAVTLSAALDQGAITTSSRFYCSGQLHVGRKIIHCAHGEVHGSCDPEEILRHSCNIGAAQVGMKLGPEKLYEADKRFGLFDKFGIDLPGEKGGFLSLDKTENIYSQAKAARVAFGQSITTTPLHIAMAYAAIANQGVLMKPRLVAYATDITGKTVWVRAISPLRRAVSQQTSGLVRGMLRSVVTEGTGKVAAVPGYQVAGKTGTAQKYKQGKFVGSFVGFLPASPSATPRAVILVAVDEPQGKHYGADVAAPAFQSIARQLMQYWHVKSDDPSSVQARQAEANIRYGDHAARVASQFRD